MLCNLTFPGNAITLTTPHTCFSTKRVDKGLCLLLGDMIGDVNGPQCSTGHAESIAGTPGTLVRHAYNYILDITHYGIT